MSPGQLASGGVPEKPHLSHGLLHQCLIHTIRTAPESRLLHAARAVNRNISCPWAIIYAPDIMKPFLFPLYTALRYCFFSTVPSSDGESGLGFSLQEENCRCHYKYFITSFSETKSEKIWGRTEHCCTNALEGMSSLALRLVIPAGRRVESPFLSQRWNLYVCQLPVITSPEECLLHCN